MGRIVREPYLAIWNRLIEKGYLHVPTTEKAWQNIANGFEKRWNFPHALGTIDGKHVIMFAPARESSTYYNYKGTHSIVLMGVCDSRHRYIMVDIGDAGRQSDGSVYNNGNVRYAFENNLLIIPKDCKL